MGRAGPAGAGCAEEQGGSGGESRERVGGWEAGRGRDGSASAEHSEIGLRRMPAQRIQRRGRFSDGSG